MQTSAPACPSASAMDRPIPELAPVTIAFWPLSNLRFSVFGTTGFGRSPKVCACGIFGFGRLIASGGMVGIVIPVVVLQIRRAHERFLTSGEVAKYPLRPARRSRATTPSYFRYELSKIVRELVTRLIQLDVIRTGHNHHDDPAVLALLDSTAELRSFRPQLADRLIDIVAHQSDRVVTRVVIRFAFPFAVRRMHAHFARPGFENEPVVIEILGDVIP